MHEIEPYYRWLQYYDVSADVLSPFYGKEYNFDAYSDDIYGYYIHPAWDFMGSETLYIKVLYSDYDHGFVVIEFIGEWNDTINNDIMHLKRNIIDHFVTQRISKFILIGENIFNFHGSDDAYYEEWFEDVEDPDIFEPPGWIAAINFPDFIRDEMMNYNIDMYINMGGTLQLDNWRVMLPNQLFDTVNNLIQMRLSL